MEQGLKRGEATYLVALVEMKVDQWVEVLNLVADVLIEYADVMPPELPKALPPKHATNHRIELQPGAKPLAKAAYRMASLELVELRKQLVKLLDVGLIQPSKAPYRALVLFKKKARWVPTDVC